MRKETKELYPENWSDISRMVIERANRICKDCGRSPLTHRVVLTTHHLDYNPAHNSLDNLVCLCQGCHLRRHGRDLKEATKYNRIRLLIRMGQLVFPGMELKQAKNLARVIEGKALATGPRYGRYARKGT